MEGEYDGNGGFVVVGRLEETALEVETVIDLEGTVALCTALTHARIFEMDRGGTEWRGHLGVEVHWESSK